MTTSDEGSSSRAIVAASDAGIIGRENTVALRLGRPQRGRSSGGWLGLALAGAGVYMGWRYARGRAASLREKVVVITGSSRGLGLLLARVFADEGCKIVICARDPVELERARLNLEERGVEVLAVPCDVTDRREVESLVERTIARFGGLDVLVNNASIIQVGPLERMTLQDFEQTMAINFWGTVHATMAVLPHMKARRSGRIVNITSIGGKVAVPHLLPYDCAKFAALGFSEGLRSEVAKDGISVTTVIPGLMRTGSWVNAVFKGQPNEEFGWFSAAAHGRLTSIDARRAAEAIVRATKRGQAEIVLGWQAKLLRIGKELFPNTAANVLSLVNRLLPHGASRGMSLAFGKEVVDARRLEAIGAPIESARD
jgi:NAD(P)-dependent dehydrogenase (short-subunit alcohol dehydrogenase family)